MPLWAPLTETSRLNGSSVMELGVLEILVVTARTDCGADKCKTRKMNKVRIDLFTNLIVSQD